MKAILLVLILLGAHGLQAIQPAPVLSEIPYPVDFFIRVWSSYDYLQYDDGTANWFAWNGSYKATWFDLDDFVPGWSGLEVEYTQFWFYHHSSYPWDTSQFFAEVWNGGLSGPDEQLGCTMLMAVHYAPVQAYYSPDLYTEPQFWVIANTSSSQGGWPSLLADCSWRYGTPHSYFSEDFQTWIPWQGPDTELHRNTWAGIKGLFR